MHSSLSWIEWLDRLDRVLKGAREDVRTLAGFESPQAVAAVERCTRQLAALTHELELLDRSVLAAKGPEDSAFDRADGLRRALDTTVSRLGTMASSAPRDSHGARERMLTAVDSALRDSCYEAAMLVNPPRYAAEPRAH